MTDLETFRDHAARMSTAKHADSCSAWVGRRLTPVHPDPSCPGCVSDADRALWARLAAEVADYLAPDEAPGLFGEAL